MTLKRCRCTNSKRMIEVVYLLTHVEDNDSMCWKVWYDRMPMEFVKKLSCTHVDCRSAHKISSSISTAAC